MGLKQRVTLTWGKVIIKLKKTVHCIGSLDVSGVTQYCHCFNSYVPLSRAAAYSKMGEHEKAIGDCQKALILDPNYGKAYGRMG